MTRRTVRLLYGSSGLAFLRQSPRHDGVFGSTQFVFDTTGPADWTVILEKTPDAGLPVADADRTIFFSGEPPGAHPRNAAYLDQFGTVVTVDRRIVHRNVVFGASAPNWHVGMDSGKAYGPLEALTFAQLEPPPLKRRLCSCITSTARNLPGQRLRADFVQRLRARLGDRIDFFGRGIRPIDDKDQGLAHYRYHIALENSEVADYWTEKLADPFLRNCYPIYWGAPNIADYFDPAAMAVIDIRNPDAAVAQIARILESDVDRTASAAIAEAKRKVMWEYNLLARIDRMIDAAEASGLAGGAPTILRPEASFLPPPKRAPWYLVAHGRMTGTLRRLRQR